MSGSAVKQAVQARISLDSRLTEMKVASGSLSRPRGGWVAAIRSGLGMSISDLARRLKVSVSTVHRLEASEVAGTINLNSLQKLADELECDLVYGLVPRKPLEQVVNDRAAFVARQQFMQIQSTMSLEQQSVQSEVLSKLIAERAQELSRSMKLWKDPDSSD